MAPKANSGDHPACPKCKSEYSSRLRREGFMQRRIYPTIGMYPWECGTCRLVFLAQGRGRKKHRTAEEDVPGATVARGDSRL